MTQEQIKWFLASDRTTPADGTSGKDMSVALVGLAAAGQGFGSPSLGFSSLGFSAQVWWPATGSPVGAFGYAVSSDNVHYDTASTASADQAPTSPSGSAGSTTISTGVWREAWAELTWTPTGGGTGAVPSGIFTVK